MVTAHAEKALSLNWQALASLGHTLVFYMGLSKSDMIAGNLMSEGLSSDCPVAVIERGCCHDQRVVTGALGQLSHMVDSHQIESPALIVVGEVVRLADQLSWYGEQGQIRSDIESQIQSIQKLSA